MRPLLLASMLVACAAPATPPPLVAKKPPPPERTPPPAKKEPPPSSAFFVLGWNEHVSDKTPNRTHICGIETETFICDTAGIVRLAGDDLVHDTALEEGLLHDDNGRLHGVIDEMFGERLNVSWLAMRSGINIGTVALYTRGPNAWWLAKKWKIESVAGDVQLVDAGGRIAALTHDIDEKQQGRFSVELLSGANSAIPLPKLPITKTPDCPMWLRWPTLSLDASRSLIVSGTRCDTNEPGWLRLDPAAKAAEKLQHEPEWPAGTWTEWRIENDRLEHRRDDGSYQPVSLPDPPIAGATPLVPFQVAHANTDPVVAARFRHDNVQGVAILRARKPKHVLQF